MAPIELSRLNYLTLSEILLGHPEGCSVCEANLKGHFRNANTVRTT
jgi:hypothetical protein